MVYVWGMTFHVPIRSVAFSLFVPLYEHALRCSLCQSVFRASYLALSILAELRLGGRGSFPPETMVSEHKRSAVE